MRFLILAALAAAAASPTAQHNAQLIAQARAAVADMLRIAVTPEEKALAEHDRQMVERAAALLAGRDGPGGSTGGSMGNSNPISSAGGDGQGQLMAATRHMQETQMSFNLQYLQLQSQMQHENRSYTAISNIMKTKHDTVKNSIGNVR